MIVWEMPSYIRMKMQAKFGDSENWPDDNYLAPEFKNETHEQTYWRMRRFYEDLTKDVYHIPKEIVDAENKFLEDNPYLKGWVNG
jgi:hypothetical protein